MWHNTSAKTTTYLIAFYNENNEGEKLNLFCFVSKIISSFTFIKNIQVNMNRPIGYMPNTYRLWIW